MSVQRVRRAAWSTSILFAMTGPTWGQPANVRVVHAAAPPGGDGRTWPTAFSSLQDGLDAAAGSGGTVNELWVAVGTYRPSHPATADPREATFTLTSNLGVYGGFAGFETEREQRDPQLNPVVLSGAIQGSAGAYHVVIATGVDQSCVLDGCIITGGDTFTGPAPREGAGIYASPGSPTLRNLTIAENIAPRGGGVRLHGNAQVHSCRIESNTAAGSGPGSGGGLYLTGSVEMRDCIIAQNTARSGDPGGGGVYGSGTFINCTFSHNAGGDNGGAAYLTGDSVFLGCVFERNRSGISGGAVSCAGFRGVFSACRFVENEGYVSGGAISGAGAAVGCAFERNRGDAGGAIGGSWQVVNCLLYGNVGGHGSAIRSGGGCTLVNCTVVGNSSPISPALSGQATVINCVIWGNCTTGNCTQAQQLSGGPFVVNYSTIEGWDSTLGGAGNNGGDPRFADPAAGDYRLLAASPCIDSGDNSGPPAGVFSDLDGHARFFDGTAPDTGAGTPPIVDRGCYEFGAPVFCYANLDYSTGAAPLNVGDFVEFMALFAAAHPLANCDGSTTQPALNVADFTCFESRFLEGCLSR